MIKIKNIIKNKINKINKIIIKIKRLLIKNTINPINENIF